MNEYLLEPFLTQYYLMESLLGDFISRKARRELFYELARVFCLDGEPSLKEWYRESNREHFRQIQSLSAYERMCRMLEFARCSGQDAAITDRDRTILAQKREAMTVRTELVRRNQNLTRETLGAALLDMAMNGNVPAMGTLAYMEQHGLCVCRDTHSAAKRIYLCGRWNDLFGCLMGLAYIPDRQLYMDILYTVLKNAGQRQVFARICSHWNFTDPCQKDPAARILEKAFGLETVRRSHYDRVFARVLFSDMLVPEDKEKLLLNRQKDAAEALSDLPLDVRPGGRVEFHQTWEMPVQRQEELRKILQNLTVARQCPPESCSPLLIAGSDSCMAQMYARMLREGFGDTPTVFLDAGTLTAQDFAGSRENVFLRGLNQTRAARTVFVIRDCQELEENELSQLIRVLDPQYRRQFKLFQPPISLDLSGLVFVLLASERNEAVARLSEVCDTVWSDRLTLQERPAMVSAIFRQRAEEYGCGQLRPDPESLEYLTTLEPRWVRSLVDGAIARAIFEEKTLITLADLQAVYREQNMAAPRRGFGYTGGQMYGKNRAV